ncbi:MAG: rane-bound lytic murein transglycosylase [Acidobacteriota bacterium]|jgi:membrane-bound lytic murein transglycosylase D
MTSRAWLPALAAIGIASTLTVACGSNPKPKAAAVPAPAPRPAPPAAAVPAPPDPIATLIETSRKHFEAGEHELKVGHLEQARAEFDIAVDVMLDSPYGARTDARTREHFDRLIDRINAYEVTALAQGDGFVEKKYEPASIDELLKIATFPKPDADAQTTAAVKQDLAATEHDVPIPQNSRVLAYVELFQGRLREFIHDGLTRGTRYLPMIQSVFRAEGLPLDLAYIPIIESGFKTNAVSKASAKGPWQFMRATATENGLHHDWYVDERSDPEKATIAAAKYLKTLSRMFNGDWNLVLAAYNGGPGRVQRAMKRAGEEDFWTLSQSSRYLPKETREYVPLILAAMIVAKNPAQYGFDIIAHEPISYDKVTVPRAIDLRRVAEWTGVGIDEIQALNPELRRWTTPVKYSDFQLKVPTGTGVKFQSRLADASPSDMTALKWYTVRGAESLTTIARKLRVSRADLAEANGLGVTSRVRPGQELIIPRAPTTLLAGRPERTAPAEVAARPLTGSVTVAAAAPRVQSPILYRVKRGDTLSSIAQLFDTTVTRIKTLNRLQGNAVLAGTRLKIAR